MPHMSDQLGIAVTAQTLGRYERGERLPDSEFLQAMVRLGCDAAWLLTGVEPVAKRPEAWDRFSQDDELFGRITEMVSAVYKEAGRSLSMVDLGRLSAENYRIISDATDDHAERLMMVKLAASQIRNELTTAKPGSGKRSA